VSRISKAVIFAQEVAQLFMRQGDSVMPVLAVHLLCRNEGINNGFFGGFHGGEKKGVR